LQAVSLSLSLSLSRNHAQVMEEWPFTHLCLLSLISVAGITQHGISFFSFTSYFTTDVEYYIGLHDVLFLSPLSFSMYQRHMAFCFILLSSFFLINVLLQSTEYFPYVFLFGLNHSTALSSLFTYFDYFF
jgi:hypothetical protein